MKYLVPVTRVLLGLPFLAFGLNAFLGFMDPGPQPEKAQEFLDAITASGFMNPIRGAVEGASGALLLLGLFVPLALVMLAPVLVHVVAYHLTLDPRPESMGFTGLLVACFLVQAWAYRAGFASLLRPRPLPAQNKTNS